MANRKRENNISFRASDEERDLIEAKRALTGMSLRSFVLESLRKKPIIVKPGGELVAGQIGRIGNNLNQLTRHLNSGFLPSECAQILREIRDEISEIRAAWQ